MSLLLLTRVIVGSAQSLQEQPQLRGIEPLQHPVPEPLGRRDVRGSDACVAHARHLRRQNRRRESRQSSVGRPVRRGIVRCRRVLHTASIASALVLHPVLGVEVVKPSRRHNLEAVRRLLVESRRHRGRLDPLVGAQADTRQHGAEEVGVIRSLKYNRALRSTGRGGVVEPPGSQPVA